MAYNIYKSDGTQLTTLDDYLIDSSTLSINLIGKNVSGYGTQQNENFLYLLENFSKETPPSSPLAGQIWFDKQTNILRPMVYDGGTWRPLAVTLFSNTTTDTTIASGATITSQAPGDFWYNTTKQQLFINNGAGYALIGPEAAPGFAETRMSSEVVQDNGLSDKPVIKLVIDNETIGIISKETFMGSPTLLADGFPYVYRGLTLKNYSPTTRYSSTNTDVLFHGIVEQLDETYPRKDQDEHITGNWYFDDFKLLQFGSAGGASISYQSFGGGFPPTLRLSHGAGTVQLESNNGTITYNGDSLVPNATNTQDLGAAAYRFNNVYTKTLNSGGPLLGAALSGIWNLAEDAQLNPESDAGNNLGKATLRYDNVYTFGLSSGADQGTIKGNWQLDSAVEFIPKTDLTNDLGLGTRKFRTIYTSAISNDDAFAELNVTGELTVDGTVKPAADNQYNIGSPTNSWNTLYTKSVETDTANVGALTASIQSLLDSFGNNITRFDRDAQLTANSDSRLPTQKSVKAYVDAVKNSLLASIAAVQSSIQSQINSLDIVPIGTIFYTASSNCPAGFIVCDGSLVSTTQYQRLFNVIGYTYGGVGLNFKLPDLRGEFVRGFDAGRGIDPGRVFGSHQSSELEAHGHLFDDIRWSEIDGVYTYNDPQLGSIPMGAGVGSRSGSDYDNGVHFTKHGTYNSTGSETRPRNVALLPIIKY